MKNSQYVPLETYIYMCCNDKFLSNLVNDRIHAETELSIRKVNRMFFMPTVLFPDFFLMFDFSFFSDEGGLYRRGEEDPYSPSSKTMLHF